MVVKEIIREFPVKEERSVHIADCGKEGKGEREREREMYF